MTVFGMISWESHSPALPVTRTGSFSLVYGPFGFVAIARPMDGRGWVL